MTWRLRARSLVSFVFGRRSVARRLEGRGKLEEAIALYLDAGAREDAARLIFVRSQASADPLQRLELLGQAASLSAANDFSLRRARLALELAQAKTLRLTRGELGELGATLERWAEPALAAEAYALAGDVEAQARVLVAAGAIERLEQVLEGESAARRGQLELRRVEDGARDAIAAGRRRDALAMLQAHAAKDERIAAEARALLARRVCGPRVELVLDGEPHAVVFGERVVVGRSQAGICISSPAVSREHVALWRDSKQPYVEDLGSRNRTTLAGAGLAAPLAVDRELVLVLGGQVQMRLAPWAAHGVVVDAGDGPVFVPLGTLEVGPFHVESAGDQWIEVASQGAAYLGELRAEGRIELCRGDEVRERPSGPVRIRVPA